jgi:hypothetical protein
LARVTAGLPHMSQSAKKYFHQQRAKSAETAAKQIALQ